MTELAGVAEFARQLRELFSCQVTEHGGDRISVPYAVPCGSWIGTELQLGFEVPGDFPRTPPHGPHFTPKLLPENTGTNEHPQRVHPSPFGAEWMHWSRPIPGWNEGDRSVATYMAWVKTLFCTVHFEGTA